MIERLGYGTYHVVVPDRQSWMLLKHIRFTISQYQLEHNEAFLIVIWQDVKKHNMPDYWQNEIGSMAELAQIGAGRPVFYDCKIFVGEIPAWRRVVYRSVSIMWPQFGRETYFCDTFEEALTVAITVRSQYERDITDVNSKRKFGS